MLRARGSTVSQRSVRRGHPFGYLATEEIDDDGTQLMIGFGPDAERWTRPTSPACSASSTDRPWL